MSQVPSIKGSVFANFAADLLELVAKGRIGHEELVRRLDPGEIELLERKILPHEWIDLSLHARVLELIRDAAGRDHLRRLSEQTADRLMEAGVYQQLRYVDRARFREEADPTARFRAFGADLRLISTLGSAVFNFSRWEATVDPQQPDRYVIEVSEAGPFSDLELASMESFINRFTERMGVRDAWRWQREGASRVAYRMTCALP